MSKYNVGDIVTTSCTKSKYGATLPAGPFRVLYTYTCPGEVALDSIPKHPTDNYVLRDDQVQPYFPTFKPGDVVEVLVECKDPVFSDKCLAGTKGVVRDPVTYGDGYIRIDTAEYGKTHDGYFVAKPRNLRLVTETAKPAIKAGDWVTTDQTSSHYGSKVPPGPLYVHRIYSARQELDGLPAAPESAHVGSGPTEKTDDVVIATRFLTPTDAPKAKPESVSPFKVGDRVKCVKHFPIGCTKTTVEGVGTVTEIDEGDRRHNTRVLFDDHVAGGDTFAWYIDPARLSLVPPAKQGLGERHKIRTGTGWTFRIPADQAIDGKRVLKELADAGADYAVVAWGKRDDQRLCLVSQRLAERAVAAGVDENLTRAVVTNFHQAFTSTANASSLAGTSNYCYVNATTLAELEDYAKRVKAAEQAKRPTTVRVNFGVAK